MVVEWVRGMKDTAERTSGLGTWRTGVLCSRKGSSEEGILQPKAVLCVRGPCRLSVQTLS